MLRVRTTFTGVSGAPWVHVSYWTGADTGAGAIAANSAIGAFWGAVDNLMNTSIAWTTDPIVAQMDPTNGLRTANFTVTPVTGAGGNVSDLLPLATQGLVQLLTGTFLAGREVRGKINVPGLCEDDSTLARLTAAAQTTIATAANTLNSATSPDLAVWSRKNGTAIAVTATNVVTQFAIRRSRRDPG